MIEAEGLCIDVIFRLKQSITALTNMENPMRRIVPISIEPSVIAIILKERKMSKRTRFRRIKRLHFR